MLEQAPSRGFWIRLEGAWRELRGHRRHAPCVEALLGEAVSASVLLAATLKFRGTLTLQLSGDGLVPLLVAQCTHDFAIRAVAREAQSIPGEPGFRRLVGAGRLCVTVEADERSARYQGIVALEGPTLAACIEAYFAASEQLPTRLALAADGRTAAGVLLQHLPSGRSLGASAQVWDEIGLGLTALDAGALLGDSAEQVLQRVCRRHDCRLFAPAPVRFLCRCAATRVRDVLRCLGARELRAIVAEQGALQVTCEFCGRPWRFDPIDVEQLFAGAVSPEAPGSLN